MKGWPTQAGFDPVVIEVEIAGVTIPVVVIVVELDVAVEGLAQLKLDVSTHVTTSPPVKTEV